MDHHPKSSSSSGKSTPTYVPEMLRLTPTRSSPLHSSPLTKEVSLPDVPTIDHGEEPKASSQPPADLPGSRRRGLSTSTIRPDHANGSIAISRVASNPLPYAQTTTASFSSLGVAALGSATRSRSSSTSRGRTPLRESVFTWRIRSRRSETPPNGVPRSWWSAGETESRPWTEVEKRKSVPPEQAEGWVRTRDVSCQFDAYSCLLTSHSVCQKLSSTSSASRRTSDMRL